ncbi:MAG TPA: hypothetical protein VH331_16580 [Allosphingosinicella sp.]|nr:hypothetical protein [Allosphingosinicella sp.]
MTAALAASAPTPAAVARMIDARGARHAVQALDRGGEQTRFDAVLDRVAAGDRRWLALVPRLAPGTDAGTAEGLRIAVAEALPKNPRAVLRLVAKTFTVEDVCGFPMIEPTQRETRAYFRAALPAVQAVTDPALRPAKQQCLAELRKARVQSAP